MSICEDGKHIHCDGDGCRAVTSHPVALRSQLTSADYRVPSVEGWLFINNGISRHFCPSCELKQLNRITHSVRVERLWLNASEKE